MTDWILGEIIASAVSFPCVVQESHVMVNVLAICRKSIPKQYRILVVHRWFTDGINEPTISIPVQA